MASFPITLISITFTPLLTLEASDEIASQCPSNPPSPPSNLVSFICGCCYLQKIYTDSSIKYFFQSGCPRCRHKHSVDSDSPGAVQACGNCCRLYKLSSNLICWSCTYPFYLDACEQFAKQFGLPPKLFWKCVKCRLRLDASCLIRWWVGEVGMWREGEWRRASLEGLLEVEIGEEAWVGREAREIVERFLAGKGEGEEEGDDKEDENKEEEEEEKEEEEEEEEEEGEEEEEVDKKEDRRWK